MGALKGRALPSRIGKTSSRLRSGTNPAGQMRRSAEQNWYKTARWQKLRRKILDRDDYICQVTGVRCTGRHPAPNSPAVDHIRPHRWDPDLFWDEANLQTVSKEWHDGEKQSLEKRGLA